MKFFQILFALALPLFLSAQSLESQYPVFEPIGPVAAAPADAPTAPAGDAKASIFKKNVTIPAGTEIFFKTQNAIDFAQTSEGQLLYLTVAQDVVVNGKVVVATNARAVGKITYRAKPTSSSPQRLEIVVESVRDVNGQTLLLNGTASTLTGSRRGMYETVPSGQMIRGFALNAHPVKF